MLRAILADDPAVQVSSAGTYGMVGWPIDEPMAQLVGSLGVDTANFTARRLTEELVREADLILTATREHRSDVVQLHPAALRYTFTLKEFVRLAAAAAPNVDLAGPRHRALQNLVPAALAQRGGQVVDAADDEIIDPYRLPDAEYRASFEDLKTALEQLHTTLSQG